MSGNLLSRGVYILGLGRGTQSMGEIGSEILTRLLDAHGAALVLYAQQWCDTPEDVTQEAFLALMRQPAMPDNAVGWMYRVVRNGAINAVRAAERRTKRESAIARENEGWFQVSIADRLDAVEAARAMEQLPIEQRETMVARLWGGLSFEEIAELTGSSTSTVHRWYQAGLVSLRERLGVTCPTKKNKTKST
jgi:RNA polymerase sigma-70 factor (ECF subfamily)